MLTADAIGELLYGIFPAMSDWLPTDTWYLPIEPHQVQMLIAQHRAEVNPTWIKNLWECEEIAMATVVAIRRQMRDEATASPRAPRYNMAIGEAYATRLNGQDKAHTVNLFVATSGVHLFDMQTGRIWQATEGDNVYFVRM